MCDVEALYDHESEIVAVSDDISGEQEPSQPDVWLSNGCWPPKTQEQIVVLIETGFAIGAVEKCCGDEAEVCLMKSVIVRGHPSLSHWIIDDGAEKIIAPKVSILPIRPVLQMKGRKKSLKFFLTNLELIQEFIRSLHSSE